MFVRIAVVWFVIGFVFTEFMLWGYEREMGVDRSEYRGQVGYLFLTVLCWPIPFGIWAHAVYKEWRREKNG